VRRALNPGVAGVEIPREFPPLPGTRAGRACERPVCCPVLQLHLPAFASGCQRGGEGHQVWREEGCWIKPQTSCVLVPNFVHATQVEQSVRMHILLKCCPLQRISLNTEFLCGYCMESLDGTSLSESTNLCRCCMKSCLFFGCVALRVPDGAQRSTTSGKESTSSPTTCCWMREASREERVPLPVVSPMRTGLMLS